MTILWLARHAKSVGNSSPYLCGNTDVPLDLAYSNEAIANFESFNWLAINYVILSNLARTQQTYDLIKPKEYTLYTIKSSLLNEQDYGELTGQLRTHPENTYNDVYKPIGSTGESFVQLIDRVHLFIKQHHAFLPDSLIIGHNNVLQALRCVLCDLEPEQAYGKSLPHARPFYIETEKL